MKIGLWIEDSSGNEFLISKDSGGYPRLISFLGKKPCLEERKEPPALSIEEGKKLYQEVTGNPYPYPHATSRQILWDLIEASLQFLP